MAESTLHVEVVSAEKGIWSGDAASVIARSVEGDLGILPGHAPLLALLAPSGAEVVTPEGVRHVIAVDEGFISVAEGRVSIIAEFARVAEEIDLASAEKELAEVRKRFETESDDEETRRRFNRAKAQVAAAEKTASQRV